MQTEAHVLLLADGTKVRVRAISADDTPMLRAFVRRLSARSRHLRFFSALIELSAAQLERLVHLDHRPGLALVALTEQAERTAIIAEARCVLDREDHSAEFAIAVADEFQRRGLGMQLVRTLIAYASRAGVRRLFGEILADNQAMLALARRLGFQVRINPADGRTMFASLSPSTG